MRKLDDLTPPELILLQKHIELGKDHLIELLGKKGFQELLEWAKPKRELVEKPDDTEITGNLVLAVNTIITGCFGGWMGLSAVMELNLGSPVAFGAVLSFATLMGAGIGYQNFRATKMDAVQNIQTLQTLQLEADILNKVHQIRNKELLEIEDELLALSPSKKKLSFSDWFPPFEAALQEKLTAHRTHAAYPFLEREIKILKEAMKEQIEVIHPNKERETRTLPPFIQVLITSHPTEVKNTKSWIRKNARKLFISLMPTLIGGFGSMFVYLSGTTQIAKAFKYSHLVSFLTTPHAKYIKLGLALLFTFYFGFSFLYSNRKAYKRGQKLEKRREALVKEESSLTLLDERLFKLRKVREAAHQINQILQMARGKN